MSAAVAAADVARRRNTATPFARTYLPSAPPFHLEGGLSDRLRALDCLALAAMAEAGDHDAGQRAVMQVILNRVRHPAFASTICGVVFEGSQRATGCQFTFTCDGALARRYPSGWWRRAYTRAAEAIDGFVFVPVGMATHYHTEWVYPSWSRALVKLAQVDTHLFFRWPGHGGDILPARRAYRGGEPAIAQLAYLPAHSPEDASMMASTKGPNETSGLPEIAVTNSDGGAFVALYGTISAKAAIDLGRRICEQRASCKVLGWFDRVAIPSGYPIPSASRTQLGFSYFRAFDGNEIVLFDCERFTADDGQSCLPRSRKRRQAAASINDMALKNHANARRVPRRFDVLERG